MSKIDDDIATKDEFSVQDVITQVISIILPALESSAIKLNIIQPEPCLLYGFRTELEQVLLVLLSNAKEAITISNPINPIITISAKHTDTDEIEISVADNGGEIPEAVIENIFDPSIDTNNLNRPITKLHDSKEIIQKHFDGKMSANNIDNGACFVIKISSILKYEILAIV